jgi:hypothetical protein
MITRVSSDLAIRVLAAARYALLLLVAAALALVSAGRGVDVPDDGGQSPAVGRFVSPAPPGSTRSASRTLGRPCAVRSEPGSARTGRGGQMPAEHPDNGEDSE